MPLDAYRRNKIASSLAAYNWWSEATHGVSHTNSTGDTPAATNFAFPITTAASFNRTLWHATGAAISREARAFMNAGHAYSTYWAPVINLAREPRWGRNLESAGEDPYLSGEYSVSFVHGFEHLPEESRYLAASACCKHYVANSMEDSHYAGVHHTRYSADPNITSQDLVDSYMLPFQACVERGMVTGLMCSYNSVNGVPSCANKWLLQTIARDSWGFDGYITSDCDAVANVLSPHHYVKTAEEAVAVTLHAGMDVDCASFVGQHGMKAYDKKLIDEALIDQRLSNLFRVRMRLQHFDPPGPLQEIRPSAICTSAHKRVAREGAAQGTALYKNVGNTLPLHLDHDGGGVKTIAVIGPNAKLSHAMAGYYGPSKVCDGEMTSVYDALSEEVSAKGIEVTYAAGVPNVLSDDISMVPQAVATANAADVVILVIGTDLSVARENLDAVNLTYSYGQLTLIKEVTAAIASTSKRVIAITLTAVPLDLTPLLSNPHLHAILHAGQPSIQTRGVIDVLLGTVAPAGRAIQTIYPPTYSHEISPFDFNMRPGPSKWPRPDSIGPCADPYIHPVVPSINCTLGSNPGRTYRFYNSTAVVPFGYGLSYTTWRYTPLDEEEEGVCGEVMDLQPLRELLEETKHVRGTTQFVSMLADGGGDRECGFAVNVTNTGTVDSDDVVLGFISPPGGGTLGRPLKTLFGFERVHVKAGQTMKVWLYP